MFTKEEIANLVGLFTWDFGNKFFIETDKGNFIWSDPDYHGDNTIQFTDKTYDQWIGNSCGRDKGKHIIAEYCGKDFTIV